MQVLSVKPAVRQTVADMYLSERRNRERQLAAGRLRAAANSPFERMAIYASSADGGLNDSENINLRGVSEGTPLLYASIIG